MGSAQCPRTCSVASQLLSLAQPPLEGRQMVGRGPPTGVAWISSEIRRQSPDSGCGVSLWGLRMGEHVKGTQVLPLTPIQPQASALCTGSPLQHPASRSPRLSHLPVPSAICRPGSLCTDPSPLQTPGSPHPAPHPSCLMGCMLFQTLWQRLLARPQASVSLVSASFSDFPPLLLRHITVSRALLGLQCLTTV